MAIGKQREQASKVGISNSESIFAINSEALNSSLENFISAMQRFADLSYEIQPICTGQLMATAINLRATPNTGTTDNIIFAVPGGASINIYANEGEWLLVNLPLQNGQRARNPEDRSPRTVSPRAFGWVHQDTIATHQCVNLETIGNANLEHISVVNPPDYTGFYFDSWEGVQLALEYAARDPDGWWGQDGLDYWELTAWIMSHEVLNNVLGNQYRPGDPTQEALIKEMAEIMYFRYRLAVEQTEQQGVSGPYEPWYQFFSGFNPPRWYGITVPSDFDPEDLESVESFFESLGVPQGGNELSAVQRRSFLKFIMSGTRSEVSDSPTYGLPLPYYERSLEQLSELQVTYDNKPFEEVEQSFGGAVYWWTLSEIECSKRPQYQTIEERPNLYESRYTATDQYLFFGTINQFENAGVAGGIKEC